MEKEVKKKPAAPPKRKRISIGEYFRGIKTETKKVVWPTRKELGSYTVVVLLTCTFFALSFWAVDSAVLAALRAVLGITF
ncbi:MAG: preprotein translocase subunit SecE [Peptostreptococcaceae bacterium]|nr:preprotein translocase subunit SecE [Peptostreptococcaceae bacterium]